jgi:hypothetical protein
MWKKQDWLVTTWIGIGKKATTTANQLYSQQNTLLNDYPAKMSLVLFDRFGGGFSAIL